MPQPAADLSDANTLGPPARYFPLRSGRYEVAPGLRPLGTDFGNGAADARVFQIDNNFAAFRANKLACRAERLSKYVATMQLSPAVETAAASFLVRQLCTEHPSLFIGEPDGAQHAAGALCCLLTGETLHFDAAMRLRSVGADHVVSPPYVSAWDALCCQVSEDVAVVCTDNTRDWISALHLCSPSHWAAENKIGRSFVQTHAPIPGFEKVNAAAAAMLDAMVYRGPWVRFVWGVETDTRLNHHPEPPPGVADAEWRGRRFGSPAAPFPFFLRVERQVLWGLPAVGAAVFVIRVSFISGTEILARPDERALLRSALLSMSPESRRYKGVADGMDALLTALDAPPAAV